MFLRDAGWPIIPVLILGTFSLWFSLLSLRSKRREARLMACGLIAATILMGVLGTVIGMQRSADAIHDTPERWIFLVGLSESLNNLVAALVIAMADALLITLSFVSTPKTPQVSEAY